jgi:hypothetical protein
MTKSPASRIGKLIRMRALSYPETTETFPWGEPELKILVHSDARVDRRELPSGCPEARIGEAGGRLARYCDRHADQSCRPAPSPSIIARRALLLAARNNSEHP